MIEVNNLSKSYSKKEVLGNVNLNISDQGLFFLMGRNGSGKTTFIKCLLGLETYCGSISFSKKPVNSVREDVYAIYDDVPLFEELNGYQNINLLIGKTSSFSRPSIDYLKLLSERKLKEKAKVYSLGERKKLLLIAAILSKPKYLIIDEISNGLDIEALEVLKEHLAKLKINTVILATGHHFEFYESITDELLILHDSTITHIANYQKGEESLHDFYAKFISSN
ncbi:MAG: ATP-binding cassette domain-containing protein [Anaerotignum sp.]